MRVAVDDNLAGVKDRLRQEGYQVVGLDRAAEADVLVTSGVDTNVLGHHDIVTRARIIDARGRTPEEIAREVARRS